MTSYCMLFHFGNTVQPPTMKVGRIWSHRNATVAVAKYCTRSTVALDGCTEQTVHGLERRLDFSMSQWLK